MPTAVPLANASMFRVKVDRNQLLFHHHIRVTGIDHGVARATLTSVDLSQALGIPVTIVNGTVEATIAGRPVRAVVVPAIG